jgi:SepF-like predicted cell division protein (DUF552 family)
MEPEIIEALRSQNWEEIAIRLLVYTRGLFSWKGISRLPKGYSAEDVVNDAVKLIYSGKRAWNPQKHPDLLIHLKWVVKSLLSSRGLLSNKDVIIESVLLDDCGDEDALKIFDEDKSVDDRAFLLRQKIECAVAGNDDLEWVLSAVLDGYTKFSDIEELTGFERARVYAAMKELRRRARNIIQDIANKE